MITIGREDGVHALHGGFIGELERAAESVSQQFSTDILYEFFLAMLADVGLHAFESGAQNPAGKNRLRIDRVPREIFGTLFPDGAVAFERQAERIKMRVT